MKKRKKSSNGGKANQTRANGDILKGRYKLGDYKKLRKRAKELQKQGYKYSALWNKLHIEFLQWKPRTISEICRRTGAYRND